jgi:S1-C subfamily serine protease
LGRESIVLGGSSGNPLFTGDYYITVFDQVSNRRQERFSIIMDFTEQPPPFLMYIPPFPVKGPGLSAALLPTVEITTKDGRGSGCIVSQEGHVLTNWHVIEALDGEVSPELYIGASFSPASPPVELFSADLIEADKGRDLALLKITSGRYNQPLPTGYQFPYFEFSDSREIQIGEDIVILGYPAMGSTGSRASITVTRGIISGFEETFDGMLFKTDSEINTGSSGGACVDTDYNLIGLPTTIIEEDSGQLGFVTPISDIPQSWRVLIRKEKLR